MTDVHKQRVALVTGGAVRLGREIALGLAERGYDLVVTYRASASQAEEVRATVEALGHACTTIQADFAEADSVARVADAVRHEHGRLDVLVNSAASFRAVPLLDVDASEWDAVMAVNVRGPHLLVRATADLLREAGGCVVNIADLGAFQAWVEYPHHAVSKAALVHLTRVQARALAPEVRVNAVAPGAVLPPEYWSEARVQAIADRTVLKRTGSPQDVVDAVHYLIRADFVTGHVLPVDGGRLLGAPGPTEG